MFFDLAQYLAGALVWGKYDARLHADGKKSNDNVEAPTWFTVPQSICFWTKVAFVVTGFVWFFIAAYGHLQFGG